MPPIKIRPGTPADWPACRALAAHLWPIPDEEIFNWASDPRLEGLFPLVHVAEQGDQLIGYARLDVNNFLGGEADAWIVVNVHPDHQHAGAGRALADAATTSADEHGRTLLTTSVRDDRPRMLRFWQARGFKEKFRGADHRRVWSKVPASLDLADDMQVMPLRNFLARPDAASLLEQALNAWNRDIHDPALFPEAKHVDGNDWRQTLADPECADADLSLVALRDGRLHSMGVLTPPANEQDHRVLQLDFTLLAPDERPEGRPDLPLPLIRQLIAQALTSGIPGVTFEVQPHFPHLNAQLATLGGTLERQPAYVILHRRASLP